MSGTWMQNVAQAILLLQLTGSGTDLGLLAACQFLPILLLGTYGGVIADRLSRRKILFFTQFASGLLAVLQGVCVFLGIAQPWMIYTFALALGVATAFDNPAKQSFVYEMVGNEHIKNAVSLNSTMVNLARVIGPTIAAVLIPTVGLAMCFILNGLSFAAVMIVLWMMRKPELFLTEKKGKGKGQLKAGFAYVLATPNLRNVLLLMTIIGMLTFEFSVILPLLAQFTFHNGTQGFAMLYSAFGFGSALGGLFSAGRKNTSMKQIIQTAFLFGTAMIITASMPTLMAATLMMVIVGFLAIMYLALCNTMLQITSKAEMRGRVMALWSITLLGTTPFGGPIIGWIGEVIGPRWGLATGGIAAIIAAGIVLVLSKQDAQPLVKTVSAHR